MSRNNWLERDPSQSPGLRRIREAQQAAALAKAQEEQRRRKAKIAAQEAERERIKRFAGIEQKKVKILPVLEEIRHFANDTKTFPLGIIPDATVTIDYSNPVVTVTPEIKGSIGVGEITLQYGFKGSKYRGGTINDLGSYPGYHETTSVLFGIRMRVDPDKILLFQKKEKEVFIPGRPSTGGRGGTVGNEPYTKVVLEEIWQELPDDETKLKDKLAVAFHDPVYLGTEKLPFRQEVSSQPDLQANAGIAGLVKGFLGIK